jgi:hypothetical protein
VLVIFDAIQILSSTAIAVKNKIIIFDQVAIIFAVFWFVKSSA